MKMTYYPSLLVVLSLVLCSYSGTDPIIQDGSPMVFWTSNCKYPRIQIYVNNQYRGDITSCYNSAPECAATGCVTVIIKGSNNKWKAQTPDGKYKWSSSPATLRNKTCTSMRLP
jgi:hypothetical protein